MDHITNEDHIRETGIGIGGEPRKGKPKTEEERKAEHIRRYGEENLPPRGTGLGAPDVLFFIVPKVELQRGGIVVDEEKALASKCHGYRIPLDGRVSELVWCAGIIGALDEAEKKKYCKTGIDWGKTPETLQRRFKILHEAGIFRD